jgi:hypothetical protein
MSIIWSGISGLDGAVGQIYGKILPVSNGTGPYTMTLQSGSSPPGLAMLDTPGASAPAGFGTFYLYGVPTTAGSYSAVWRATDSLGAFTDATVAIVIHAFEDRSMLIPPLYVGQPYSFTLTTEFAVSALNAAGFSSGLTPPYIYGTPAAVYGDALSDWGLAFTAGVFSSSAVLLGTVHGGIGSAYEVSVTDSSGTPKVAGAFHTFLAFDVPLNVSPLSIGCGNPPAGTIGLPYSHTFPVTGLAPPFTFAILSGALPAGLSLDTATGIVSGTPSTETVSSFTVQVTDNAGTTASVACSIATTAGAWLIINEPSLGLTDRTPYLFVGDGQQNSFSTQLRQRGQATIHLFVAAGDSYAPTRGAPVFLYDQTSDDAFLLVFSGLIQDIENQWTGQNAGDHFVLLTAVSLESVFDTVYATPVQYVNQTAGAIVADLFSRFETGCPVGLGTISAGVIIPLFNTNYEKLSELFGQLATTSGYTWYVDPSTSQLMFVEPSTIPAPFTVSDQPVLWDSITWKVNGADYRNRQAVRLSFDAFGKSGEFFVGAGQSSVVLKHPVNQVTSAYATLSTPNTATGTFSGNPSLGDTVKIAAPAGAWQALHIYGLGGIIIDAAGHLQAITTAGTSGASIPTFNDLSGNTIDGSVIWTDQGAAGLSTGDATYTFVPVLDNRLYGQVLIGATAAETCQNLADAINANDAVRGITFSLPTWEDALCNAVAVSGSSFTLQQKAAGAGWTTALSDTCANFSWSSSVTTGGTSPNGSLGPGYGATITLQVYVFGTSTAAPGIAYTPGSAVLNLATPLNVGSNLNVFYTRAGGDILEVEDTAAVLALAAITHGTGKYQQITNASTTGLIATSAAAGLQFAQEALAAFSVAPQAMEFQTYAAGLQAGMNLPLELLYPAGGTALLNGNWVIEEINAELVPVEFWIGDGGGHFRYTIKSVNIQEIGSYLDFWEGLGGGGSGGGGVSGLVATSGGGLTASLGVGTVTHTTAALAAHKVVVGNGVDDLETIASAGTAGQYLRSGGSSADPAMATIAQSEVTSLTTDLAAKVPTSRTISTTAPLTGGGDLSADRTLAISAFTGDSGSGGAKGAVPAPAAGDAAAGKFIKADGTWAVPSGGSGTVTHTGAALAAHKVVVGNGTDDVETIAATGTAGQYLRSGGASADPAMAAIAESEVTNLVTDLALKAPLASPTFTGTPLSTTPSTADSSTKIATTAYVQAQSYVTAATAPVTSVAGHTGAVTLAESDIASLVTDLAAKAPGARLISTTAPLTGGGDLSADRTLAISAFTGDSGSGGAKGAVPAPAAGDAAAGKFLSAGGGFAVPPGTTAGTVTHTAGALTAHAVILGNGSSDLEAIASPGTAGQFLRSAGASADPAFADLTGTLGVVIDGGGSAPATGSKGFLRVPYACTITSWTMIANASGSAVITVKACAYGSFPTTASIVASAKPTLSTQQNATSSSLTGWTIALALGDVLEFNLDSVTTCARIILELQVTKT